MSFETANIARGRWPGILQILGVDPKFLKDVHGPCPICGGTDRFRFDDQQNGTWFCNQCTQKGERPDGFSLLQKLHGWDFKRTASEIDKIVGRIPEAATRKPEQDPEAKVKYMTRIWMESVRVTPGDPVWLYLSKRCGDPSAVLDDLRYHPALHHSVDGGEHPAMLARMRSADGKKGIGIHRTYLTCDGQKARVDPVRMSYGEVGTVRLGLPQVHLGIAEGIETAICAGKIFSLPVWAAISANGLQAWEPPAEVQSVLICGDNDESCTGQAAAWNLARRLKGTGLKVEVQIPETTETDWADVQRQVAA